MQVQKKSVVQSASAFTTLFTTLSTFQVLFPFYGIYDEVASGASKIFFFWNHNFLQKTIFKRNDKNNYFSCFLSLFMNLHSDFSEKNF